MNDLDWSAGGTRLAAGSVDGGARVFEVTDDGFEERVSVVTQTGQVWWVSLSADGRRLLPGDQLSTAAAIWDVDRAGGVGLPSVPATSGPWRSDAALTPDGDVLVAADQRAAAAMWDLETGTARLRLGEGRDLRAASRSARTATSSPLPLRRRSCTCGTGSPGRWRSPRRFLTLPGVRVWDWQQGDRSSTCRSPRSRSRSRQSVTGSRRTPSAGVILWDLLTGERLVELRGHAGDVVDLSFSADGGRVATAGDDGTVRIWAADTGAEQFALHGHDGPVESVALSPDGDRRVSIADGLARVWAIDVDELKAIARESVTRSLTDGECPRYLHAETCPDQPRGASRRPSSSRESLLTCHGDHRPLSGLAGFITVGVMILTGPGCTSAAQLAASRR